MKSILRTLLPVPQNKTTTPLPSQYYDCFYPGLQLDAEIEEWCKRYKSADPFPHIVLDNLFNPDLLQQILGELPSPFEAKDLLNFDAKHLQENKFAFRDDPKLGTASRYFFGVLNGKTFLEFLSKLTGVEGLLGDPYLHGGGFHQILKGGKLAVHADFNVHPITKLQRRLNILIYLNRNWKEEWKGHLELWDKSMQHCVKKLLPVFNRTVIFTTDDHSYHGHPDPLECPPDMIRKSIALYYYTNGRPAAENSDSHCTLWQDRPQDNGIVKSTVEKLGI